MLQKHALGFLRQLAVNNNRPWFEAHREDYETAKTEFEHLITHMLQLMSVLEPALAGQRAKDCIFRVYRDVRFSKDKTPYKSHFSAYFSKNGKKDEGAGYYLHLEPGKSFAAGGIWMPGAPVLKAVRQEIDYNYEEFASLLAGKEFRKRFRQLEGERLKTAPKGYSPDNPAIGYLTMKSFIASHPFEDREVAGKNFPAICFETFSAMAPLIAFLNRSLD